MGLFDKIHLIEPLPCYSCGSTIETEVGTAVDEGKIEIKGQELKIMRLHDGRGGIKTFQTKDLMCYVLDYRFPGYIPMRALDGPAPDSLSLIEICNACGTVWDGTLPWKYEEKDEIFVIEGMEIWPREEDLAGIVWRLEQNEFYNLSAQGGRIQIEANVEQAIRRYHEESRQYQRKAETFSTFLDSIKDPRVPIKKLKELFEQAQSNVCSLKKEYANRLASAQENNEIQESMLLAAEGVLKAALMILYQHDKEAAINLVQLSGVSQQKEFQRTLKDHEWFFGGEETWQGHSDSASLYLEKLQPRAQQETPSQPSSP